MASSSGISGRLGGVLRALGALGIAAASTGVIAATGMSLPYGSATPLATDGQGFVGSPARCGPNQTAVIAGRTALSLVAICTDGRGHYEYRGSRISDGAVLVLPAKPMANGCFGARTEAVSYTVSERKLLLTAGLRVLRDETMLEFKDFRAPAAAPIAQEAAHLQFG